MFTTEPNRHAMKKFLFLLLAVTTGTAAAQTLVYPGGQEKPAVPKTFDNELGVRYGAQLYVGDGRGPELQAFSIDYARYNFYFVGYFYNLTHSISYRLRIYISHPQQTCTKIAIKKSNEGGARAYWQVGFEIIDVFLFRLPSHLSLGWSCFLSNVCPRISSCFGLIIWHKAVRFDIFSNRR